MGTSAAAKLQKQIAAASDQMLALAADTETIISIYGQADAAVVKLQASACLARIRKLCANLETWSAALPAEDVDVQSAASRALAAQDLAILAMQRETLQRLLAHTEMTGAGGAAARKLEAERTLVRLKTALAECSGR